MLPWLEGKVANYVKEMEMLYEFPDEIVNEFGKEFEEIHVKTVEDQR